MKEESDMMFVPWKIEWSPGSDTRIETADMSTLVTTIHGDSSLSLDVARHVVGLHEARMDGHPMQEAFAPSSWYADLAWSWDQVMRRPWKLPMFGTSELDALADSQFGDTVLSGGNPLAVAYIVVLHNNSLLPVR